MIKHYTLLDRYFCKFRKINRFFSGIIILNNIYFRYLFKYFSLFGNHARLFNIKKKYLKEFIDLLDRGRIKCLKNNLLRNIIEIAYYRVKNPLYLKFLITIEKIILTNVRKGTFIKIKKLYFSQKLFYRNMKKFADFMEALLLKRKEYVFNQLNIINERSLILKKLFVKKYLKEIYHLKRSFQRFIDYALTNDKYLFVNLKLKKAYKIYQYKLKLHLIKVIKN